MKTTQTTETVVAVRNAVSLLGEIVMRAGELELGAIRELALDARAPLVGVLEAMQLRVWIVRCEAGEAEVRAVDVCEAAHYFRESYPDFARARILGVRLVGGAS